MGVSLNKRLVSADTSELDSGEVDLRPRSLDEYIGQRHVVSNLRVFLQAAKLRKEPVDHILLCGPPGLGKTTLARLVAEEMDADLKVTSGPAIGRPIDLLVLLNGIKRGDVLFIDEIHRLSRVVEEILYSVMEDLCFDRVINKGFSKGSRRHKLSPFTLVGATTRGGALSAPLRSRFGITLHLEYYAPQDLQSILLRSASILGFTLTENGAAEIAQRCRGTPRIANRLLRRVRDYAQVIGDGTIDQDTARRALDMMGIDKLGLDRIDQRILDSLVNKFQGKPVGLSTLAAAVQEEPANLVEVYEPFLLSTGLLQRTPRGRQATPRAYAHLGLQPPAT